MMWEFPGGKVEQGETDAEALDRELLHRLGVRIQVGKLISFVTHPYEHYVVDLFLYECRIVNGALEPRAVTAFECGRRRRSSTATRSRRRTKRR